MTDLTKLADRQAEVVRLVASGLEVREAAARVFVQRRAVANWRRVTPGFAERLDHAKHVARIRRTQGQKDRLLDIIMSGRSVVFAATEIGVARGTVTHWRRMDAAFAADYARAVGPTHKTYGRELRLILFLSRGYGIKEAAKAAGLSFATVYTWQKRAPELWAEIQRARAAA